MKEIIEQMKDDILNGEELQYDYEIDGVSITVLMDYSGDEIQIIATSHNIDNTKTWEVEYGNEDELDDTLDELAKFIKYESIYKAIYKAIYDYGMKKNVDTPFGLIATADCGSEVQISFYKNKHQSFIPTAVSVTVNNYDLNDDEDGVIGKVAEFFANY